MIDSCYPNIVYCNLHALAINTILTIINQIHVIGATYSKIEYTYLDLKC